MTTRTFNSVAFSAFEQGPREVRETCHSDRFGRLIGGQVYRFAANAVALAEGETAPAGWSRWSVSESIPTGPVFGYIPGATRNGEHYGASQGRRFFSTEAARDAAVEKYFADVEKRARKAAAGKAVQS